MTAGHIAGASLEAKLESSRRTAWWEGPLRLRRKPLGVVGLALILLMLFVAIFAPLVAPHDPTQIRMTRRLQPPGLTFPFGTDNVGRDVFSRVVYGARISLTIGALAVTLGTVGGALLGLVSGYVGGRLDFVLQRAMDMIQSFPLLILALVIVAMLGASTRNVIIAIAVVLIPGAGRIVRGSTLSVRTFPYIEAARTVGASDLRIVALHVLPNVAAPIIVIATATLGSAILVESSLSFLGLGSSPTAPTWGGMLSIEGRTFFQMAPWLAVFPGLAISVAVLGFNLLGDALRDLWDPTLRRR
ncbi:MAG: ABC transporter permease [Dehalococcoidia bacterium]